LRSSPTTGATVSAAAGAEGAAFALDHEHANGVGGLDSGAKLFEFLGDREVDRIERRGTIEREGRDGPVDAQQRGIVGQGYRKRGCRHLKIPGLGWLT
jgi:hypothetical protein